MGTGGATLGACPARRGQSGVRKPSPPYSTERPLASGRPRPHTPAEAVGAQVEDVASRHLHHRQAGQERPSPVGIFVSDSRYTARRAPG